MSIKSRILLVVVGLLVGTTTMVVLWHANTASKITVSFINVESSYAGDGPLWNVECQRLAFAVRNDGKQPVPFVVSDVQDNHGKWIPSPHNLDTAAAGKTTHVYLYVPKGAVPQAVRMRGYRPATTAEKAQCALRFLIEKASGRYPLKLFWFEKLSVPAYEFAVKIDSRDRISELSRKAE